MEHDIKKEIQKFRQDIKSERMDMSFGEIINMYKDKEIIITPEYQRAFRWDKDRQSQFIESILLGIPFPPIFVATNNDGKWELIDGLQRVSTVLSFFGELKNEKGTDDEKNNLVLTTGSLLKNLNGITLESLPLEYKLQIKRTACRVEIILKESDFKMRYELFKRLNTGGEGLSRQEIRNCIYRGLDIRYNNFVRELASNTIFRKLVPLSKQKIEEMYYEEIVLRYLTLKNAGTRYKTANIQDYMDEYMEKQSQNLNQKLMQLDKERFIDIINFINEINYPEIFRLGTQNFTTSMFDALMLTFSDCNNIKELDSKDFYSKIDTLKNNDEFNKYVGSASSNPTSITRKYEIAKQILLEIEA